MIIKEICVIPERHYLDYLFPLAILKLRLGALKWVATALAIISCSSVSLTHDALRANPDPVNAAGWKN